MRYSRTNIVNAHLQFLQSAGVEVTQEQLNRWALVPVKFLAKTFAQERLALLKKESA